MQMLSLGRMQLIIELIKWFGHNHKMSLVDTASLFSVATVLDILN